MNLSAKHTFAALTCVCALTALAACGSSSSSSAPGSSNGSAGSSSAGSGSEKTITLGLETASTGPLASSFGAGAIAAAKARVDLANATHEVPGVNFKLVTADEANSPTGALQAVQLLTQSKGASAILAAGPYFFGAWRYTAQHNIPAFGIGIDGPEWADPQNKNLFSYEGSTDPSFPSYDGIGAYMKSKGVTTFCGLAYGGVSASVDPAKAMIASIKRSGIAIGYQNLNIPLGGSDFGAVAAAMKNAHCNGLGTWFVVSSDIALFNALHAVGLSGSSFKGSYITGVYGQELLDDPAARQAAQGYGVGSVFEPASLNTAATKTMMSALAKYANYSKPYPLSSHQWGWFTADLAIYAYKNAGSDHSAGNVIDKLRAVTNYDAGGIQCPIDFSKFKGFITQYSGNCAWIATVQGDNFVAPPDPTKMTLIAGTSNG
jgi:ABC-type branched-subunit amino acid transport system substrate-binding protein